MKMKRVILAALVMVLAFSLMPVNAEAASAKTRLVVSQISLLVGGEFQIHFVYNDELCLTPKGKKVTWSSNNKKVATVSKKGKVTAKKIGTAKITAKVNGKKYTCTVKVVKPNASDVKVLKKIIKAQKKKGAKVSSKMNSGSYYWNDKGRLISIYWGNCKLKGSISFAGLKELTSLVCSNNQLSSLNVSKNTKLKVLDCQRNQLSSLNVNKNTKLTHLNCDNNQLSSLDVSKNTKLEDLWCQYNQLSNLNVSKNTKLKQLICSDNQLSDLDVSKNTKLEWLSCRDNKISRLDLTNNKKLTDFSCDDTVEVIGYNK